MIQKIVKFLLTLQTQHMTEAFNNFFFTDDSVEFLFNVDHNKPESFHQVVAELFQTDRTLTFWKHNVNGEV